MNKQNMDSADRRINDIEVGIALLTVALSPVSRVPDDTEWEYDLVELHKLGITASRIGHQMLYVLTQALETEEQGQDLDIAHGAQQLALALHDTWRSNQ